MEHKFSIYLTAKRSSCFSSKLSKRKAQRNSQLDKRQLVNENWVFNALLKTLLNPTLRPSAVSLEFGTRSLRWSTDYNILDEGQQKRRAIKGNTIIVRFCVGRSTQRNSFAVFSVARPRGGRNDDTNELRLAIIKKGERVVNFMSFLIFLKRIFDTHPIKASHALGPLVIAIMTAGECACCCHDSFKFN